ncbi:MAG: glycoside hydrolase family 25 protein [Coriobacteriales bacterium]|jgi:GH25 family lysozyme M1 (1,4-beta-N-acetylmuramidase)|nr:glycoside hydrolase family 25 protein [Coriobacteriales bacterium]
MLLGLALLGLAACGSEARLSGGAGGLGFEPAYQSPYDPQNLIEENGRFSYAQDGQVVSRTGIDVSAYQGSIDWEAVAADGIDFAILRLGHRGYTEGSIYLDERFEENLRGAEAAGVPVGVYFFSQAITEQEAIEEARFVLETLDGRELAYPVVYDFEPVSDVSGRANGLNARQLTKNASAFCTTIEEGGYPAMLYGNARDISHYYLDLLEGYDIWFAEYGTRFPTGKFDFTIWQYTNAGSVAGISGNVDMDLEFMP